MIAYIETVDLWKSRAYSDSVRISIKSHGRTFKVPESVRVALKWFTKDCMETSRKPGVED